MNNQALQTIATRKVKLFYRDALPDITKTIEGKLPFISSTQLEAISILMSLKILHRGSAWRRETLAAFEAADLDQVFSELYPEAAALISQPSECMKLFQLMNDDVLRIQKLFRRFVGFMLFLSWPAFKVWKLFSNRGRK